VTAADRADGDTCSRSAAALIVPASATATKAASWFSVKAGAPSAFDTGERYCGFRAPERAAAAAAVQ
jgi:hypothetical protein